MLHGLVRLSIGIGLGWSVAAVFVSGLEAAAPYLALALAAASGYALYRIFEGDFRRLRRMEKAVLRRYPASSHLHGSDYFSTHT